MGLRLNSAVQESGTFSCSNEKFNAIQKMCQWTFLSNIFSVQSDCPHRERFGYGGDLVKTNEGLHLNMIWRLLCQGGQDWHDAALATNADRYGARCGIQYCGVHGDGASADPVDVVPILRRQTT
jgi:alpha-L-rhamnosidase